MNSNLGAANETVLLRRAFAAMSRDAAAAEDCPPGERLWAAARGERGAGDVRELIEHVASCGACAEAWRLARELEPSGDAREHRPAARPWWQQPAWTAVAIAAMVVLVLGLSWRQPADRPADVVRGAGPVQVLRIPADGGRLDRQAPVLRWQATENATYDLVVTYDDLEPFFTVYDLESAEYLIPDEEVRGVPAGAAFLWRVQVKAASGLSEMPTYRFVLE